MPGATPLTWTTSSARRPRSRKHRAVLFGVAYRMVGQVSDAEDVVQEAWLRWAAAARADVRDPRAFLVHGLLVPLAHRFRRDRTIHLELTT